MIWDEYGTLLGGCKGGVRVDNWVIAISLAKSLFVLKLKDNAADTQRKRSATTYLFTLHNPIDPTKGLLYTSL